MYEVGIVFKNGSKAQFYAQEFNIAFTSDDVPTGMFNETHKFTYKDTQGDDAPIYLNPSEVAGIAVVRVEQYSEELRVS